MGTVSVLSPLERFRELQDELEQCITVCHRPSEKVVRDWVAKLAAETALAQSVAQAEAEAGGAGGEEGAGGAPALEAQVAAFREKFAAQAAEVGALLEAAAAAADGEGGEGGGDEQPPALLLATGTLAAKREELTLLRAQAAHLQRKGAAEAEMREAGAQLGQLLQRLQRAAHPPDGAGQPGAKRTRRKAEQQPTDSRALSRFLSNSMISLRRKLSRVAAWAQCDVALFVRFNTRRSGTAFGLIGSDPLPEEDSVQLAEIFKARALGFAFSRPAHLPSRCDPNNICTLPLQTCAGVLRRSALAARDFAAGWGRRGRGGWRAPRANAGGAGGGSAGGSGGGRRRRGRVRR